MEDQNGLILFGLIVASKVDKGLRRDDGKPWCARTSQISTGTDVFAFRESGLDPVEDHEPLKINEPIRVNVSYARTENGNTTVGGQVIVADQKVEVKKAAN